MAEVRWTGRALDDLDEIADYIALDKPDAAARLVKKIVLRVAQLASFPETGSFIPEMSPDKVYRQIIVPPCRTLYRFDKVAGIVYILSVMRGERLFRPGLLSERDLPGGA